MNNDDAPVSMDFIRRMVQEDNRNGTYQGRVSTRFPPEPNGFLHIGHAKSICLNFGVARENNGTCNLRMDDTNPLKESQVYIDSIQEDVRWMGFDWENRLFYASDYFEPLYRFAETLIQQGKAYVCSLSAEETRAHRGTLTEPGRDSPYRNRSMEENLDLFRRMRAGEFPDGAHVLRAKIDMASPNINMRDPTLYRIRRASHHQTGDAWCIYPMYDYAHCLSDALEKITHSLCTLEFEDHRPLYDWILEQLLPPPRPQQIEFSRLSLEYTVLSKRKLNQLVQDRLVDGWNDPRMPTLAGMRRRGYPAAAIREFCARIGISKADNRVEMALLENCVREELDRTAPRVMAVLRPLKVVLVDFPADRVDEIPAANHPKDESLGQRTLPLTRELFIERDDFMEVPPKGYKRLIPGGEVRLRHAFVIRCEEVIKDPDSGAVVELRCTHDPATMGANPEGRKVKGVIHWVSAPRSLPAEVRLYDRLFTVPDPDNTPEGVNFTDRLNPNSLEVIREARLEEGVAQFPVGQGCQFERLGFFTRDSSSGLVFNRTVTLRDSWSKSES